MESRVYIVDGNKMQFDSNNFKILIKSYGKRNKLKSQDVERSLANGLNVSTDTVHKWHYGMSTPTDVDLVKELAKILDLEDFTTLLKSADGGNSMGKLTERQITAVKKVYDICIWFLNEFSNTSGFNDYWYTLQDKGVKDPEVAIADMADDMHRKIELVLDQEYFDLRDTDIYNELCEFVSDDLIDIYDGKVSYAYRFEAHADGNPTTSEDYDKAMIKLNGIIEKYV